MSIQHHKLLPIEWKFLVEKIFFGAKRKTLSSQLHKEWRMFYAQRKRILLLLKIHFCLKSERRWFCAFFFIYSHFHPFSGGWKRMLQAGEEDTWNDIDSSLVGPMARWKHARYDFLAIFVHLSIFFSFRSICGPSLNTLDWPI